MVPQKPSEHCLETGSSMNRTTWAHCHPPALSSSVVKNLQSLKGTHGTATSPCSKGTWVGTGQGPPGALRAEPTRETEDVRHAQTPVILTLIWGTHGDSTTMRSKQSTSGSWEKKNAHMLQNQQEQIGMVCRTLSSPKAAAREQTRSCSSSTDRTFL